jgi:hypothetical protein
LSQPELLLLLLSDVLYCCQMLLQVNTVLGVLFVLLSQARATD